jgi:hypothetical protein
MSIARTLSRIGIARNYGGNSRITDVSKACQFGDRYKFDFYESIGGRTFDTKTSAPNGALVSSILTVGTAA